MRPRPNTTSNMGNNRSKAAEEWSVIKDRLSVAQGTLRDHSDDAPPATDQDKERKILKPVLHPLHRVCTAQASNVSLAEATLARRTSTRCPRTWTTSTGVPAGTNSPAVMTSTRFPPNSAVPEGRSGVSATPD